jgi:hypothetical protein
MWTLGQYFVGEIVAGCYHKTLVLLYKAAQCHITQDRNYNSFQPDVRKKCNLENYL